jgi:hypothetical protein
MDDGRHGITGFTRNSRAFAPVIHLDARLPLPEDVKTVAKATEWMLTVPDGSALVLFSGR